MIRLLLCTKHCVYILTVLLCSRCLVHASLDTGYSLAPVNSIDLNNSLSPSVTRCQQQDSCSCVFDDGTKINLASLGNSDQTPRFKDVKSDSDGNFYSYNPCLPFTELQGDCTGAAVCILNADKSEAIMVGSASRAGFQYNLEIQHVVAAYTAGDITRLRLSEVILVCDHTACSPSIVANGQQQSGEFQLTLTTVCACPNGCTSSGPVNCKSASGGISVGSILLIAFVVIVLVYLVAGTVVMKFIKKKNGIEVIPNVTTWRILPVLIKGGVVFTFSRCRKTKTYDSI